MWIDQCVPTVLNYKGSDVEFASKGTVYQIQALGNGATVKALTLAGTVYGNGNAYSSATGITMLPGERWEGLFVNVVVSSGDVVVHDLPGNGGGIIGGSVLSLSPALYAGRMGYDIKHPVVTSLPTIVTNGVSYVVGGVEYLGISGTWVAQSAVTLGLWISVGNSWVPVGDVPSDLCVIPIIASGTGAGVSVLRLTSSVDSVVSIDGVGKFYTDAAGTVGESTSVNISANNAATIYVRLASGTATITVTNCSKIIYFGTTSTSCWVDSTNSPFVNKFNLYYTQTTQNIYFSGNNIAITGTTYPWVNATQSIFFNGNNIALTHEYSLTLGTKYNRWYIRPATSVFTSAMVDRLLIDLAATWTAPTPSSPIVDLRGNCGSRTSASDAAVATLQGCGITVSTN
jgi:hypothetical protein